jgi:WD40 repeat protein/nucleoside phosphorylase
MGEARVDVLIVTALKDELDAVLELSIGGKGRDGWTSARDRSDFPYYRREIPNEQGELLQVAAAWSGDMGQTAATARAMSLIQELDPGCLAMCGICAGHREKVFLGDVIVADRVFSYDHGKLVAGEQEADATFFHDITTYNLDQSWKMDAAFFAEEFTRRPQLEKARPLSAHSQQRWLLQALREHELGAAPSPVDHPERKSRCPDFASCIKALRKQELIKAEIGKLELTEKGRAQAAEERLIDPDGQKADEPFRVHVAPLATGKVVQEDPRLFERLSRHVRKVLGAEMEATAIGFVAEQLERRLFIAKAVSDYADHEKDDAFRDFACHASAVFLVAFLRRHLRPAQQAPAPPLRRSERRVLEPEREPPGGHQDGFLTRVEQVCGLRHPPGTKIERVKAPAPFGVLEVTEAREGFIQTTPVAAIEQPMTEELLAAFLEGVDAAYRRQDPMVFPLLVHAGPAASEELSRRAHAQRVRLISFAEYQGLFDFSTYLQRQTARLENDLIYPPSLYVKQRATVSIGGGEETETTEDVLKSLSELLRSPHPRFALVLGDFGTGKTFLLHELARRMASEKTALVPVLIEMRSLQKHRTLKALIAQHFAAADLGRLEPDKFLYMLKSGRIALLFDGFDELALRVTYDQVMEHFGTLIEAAQGEAKVVVTSRTQHFLTDQQVKRELGERAAGLPGYRLIKLEKFSDKQVWSFLEKRLGSAAAADERMRLLSDVQDLHGLAVNPRMLSFIADLDEAALREARARSGQITSAKLYELLINRWLVGEYQRSHPRGAEQGLTFEQFRRGATEISMLLWERPDHSVDVRELPPGLFKAVNVQGAQALDREIIRHQLGSGTLLVRDAEGRSSFIHQSILEWLVADVAAQVLIRGGEAAILERREMSDLMADFFIELAKPEAARRWAESKADSADSDVLRGNALRVMRRLTKGYAGRTAGSRTQVARNLERSDLRGHDLSEADLRRANLAGTNFAGATLVRANLIEANLRQANLKRANLEKAVLRGADLAGAELSGARLLGADLRGAKLQGTNLQAARLVGAQLDSLEGLRLFGAALPSAIGVAPTLGIAAPVRAVAFNPTGELLATAHVGGAIQLWDAETGHALRTFEEHSDTVQGLAFSPGGTVLASVCDDGTVILWDVEHGRPLHTLLGHREGVTSVAFSPDGKVLATGSEDKTVILWSIEQARPLRTLEGHEAAVRAVAFSPHGRTLASGGDDRNVILWNLEQARPLRILHGHGNEVLSLAFSPDGRLLASGSVDRTLILWGVEQAMPLATLQGHGGFVRSVAFSPDGRTLASGSADRTVILWSAKQAKPLQTLKGHTSPVWAVAFSSDGRTLASGSDDRAAILWSVEQAHPLRSLQGHGSSVRSVAFGPDGRTQALGFEDGSIALWNVQHPRLRTLQGQGGTVLSLAFSPDGRLLAAGVSGGLITLWNLEQARPVGVLQGHRGGVLSLAFSPDGRTLASGGDDRCVIFWSVEQARLLRSRPGNRGAVLSLAFSPDGKTLASGSDEGVLTLWSVEQALLIRVLRGHAGPVRGIAFSPNGRLLASSSDEQNIFLWSLELTKPLRALKMHRRFVRSVVFSPDGNQLAVGTDDGGVALWNIEQASILYTRQGHRNVVSRLAFSPDGAGLASGSLDGTVCFWEAQTGRQQITFLGHLDGWIAFRPDGRFKSGGDVTGVFWHAIGLCRFEPGELDLYLPKPLRLPDGEPLIARG